MELQIEVAKAGLLPSQPAADLVRVMAKDWMATGLKLRIRGYRSMGDSVPLVMTTVWNFWNTGRTARLASKQLSCAPPQHTHLRSPTFYNELYCDSDSTHQAGLL